MANAINARSARASETLATIEENVVNLENETGTEPTVTPEDAMKQTLLHLDGVTQIRSNLTLPQLWELARKIERAVYNRLEAKDFTAASKYSGLAFNLGRAIRDFVASAEVRSQIPFGMIPEGGIVEVKLIDGKVVRFLKTSTNKAKTLTEAKGEKVFHRAASVATMTTDEGQMEHWAVYDPKGNEYTAEFVANSGDCKVHTNANGEPIVYNVATK